MRKCISDAPPLTHREGKYRRYSRQRKGCCTSLIERTGLEVAEPSCPRLPWNRSLIEFDWKWQGRGSNGEKRRRGGEGCGGGGGSRRRGAGERAGQDGLGGARGDRPRGGRRGLERSGPVADAGRMRRRGALWPAGSHRWGGCIDGKREKSGWE